MLKDLFLLEDSFIYDKVSGDHVGFVGLLDVCIIRKEYSHIFTEHNIPYITEEEYYNEINDVGE